MTITLYKFPKEKNLLDKSGDISSPLVISNVVYKMPTSIINPILVIQTVSILEYNYLLVSELNRYYFIDEIIFVANNVYEVHCSIDVLNTYKIEIKALTVKLDRSYNRGYTDISDDYDVFSADDKIDVIVAQDGSYTSIETLKFEPEIGHVVNTVLNVFNDYEYPNPSYTEEYVAPANLTCLPTVKALNVQESDFNYRYILTGDATYISKFAGQNYAGGIKSLIVFPFDIDIKWNEEVEQAAPYLEEIRVLSTNTGKTAYIPTKFNDGYRLMKSIRYTPIHNPNVYYNTYPYEYYEPYSSYFIFVPYVGWKKIAAKEILNKQILIIYTINYTTGEGVAYIVNKDNDYIVAEYNCQIGVKIGISRDNQEQLNNQSLSNGITMVLGTLAGAVVGLAANPVIGASMAIGSIASGFSKQATLKDMAEVDVTNGYKGIFNPTQIYIKRVYKEKKTDNEAKKAMIGLPSYRYDTLNLCTGYTKVGEVHVEGTANDKLAAATQTEKDMIEAQLKAGILI